MTPRSALSLRLLLTLGVFVFCILTTNLAEAGTIDWMSGDFTQFNSDHDFDFSQCNQDCSWVFYMNFEPDANITWTPCDPNDVHCVSHGVGPIVGGTVGGNLYYQGGNLRVEEAYFIGSIGSGYFDGYNYYYSDSYEYEYWFEFAGVWSNGISTDGTGHCFSDIDGSTCGYHLTTVTPEPGTLLTLNTGVLFVLGLARKRLFR